MSRWSTGAIGTAPHVAHGSFCRGTGCVRCPVGSVPLCPGLGDAPLALNLRTALPVKSVADRCMHAILQPNFGRVTGGEVEYRSSGTTSGIHDEWGVSGPICLEIDAT
jgi:hypothetical protein